MSDVKLQMDINGQMFNDIRHVKNDDDSIHCPTKTCFRHKGSYSLKVRGSNHCDNCGATMKPRKTYWTERIYL